MFLSVFIIQASLLHFSEEPQSQDALHGRSALLRCELSGPEDMHYWWTQDGRRVQDSNRRFQEGSNLKFTAVDRHTDTGSFQCVASSSSTGETVTSVNASINIKCELRLFVSGNQVSLPRFKKKCTFIIYLKVLYFRALILYLMYKKCFF